MVTKNEHESKKLRPVMNPQYYLGFMFECLRRYENVLGYKQFVSYWTTSSTKTNQEWVNIVNKPLPWNIG